MITKFFLLFTLLGTFLSSFIGYSYADGCDASDTGASVASFLADCSKSGANGSTNGIAVNAQSDITGTTSDVKGEVKSIAEKAIAFGALLAVGAIVWAGIQYTKSFGEDESLKKAKNTGIYALIGLILLMGAFGFIDIILNFLYSLEK